MNLSKKQLIMVAGGAFIVIILVALVFFSGGPSGELPDVTIRVWGIEDSRVFEKVVTSYKQFRPNATVEYTQIEAGNYKNSLLNALASGGGPDVFYIGSRELPKEKDKLSPVNPVQFNFVSLRELFPVVVEQDFVSDGQIYALPLYIDTLAMIYNKNLFDNAGIASPPKTWDELLKIIPKLRSINESNQITKAAAAIGGSDTTVDSGVDLLHLLMLQNGTSMTNENLSSAEFASQQIGGPGFTAFNFYLQFANAGSPHYTWNDGQPNSLDSFASGKAAIIFNYHSALAPIKVKSPFLNLGIAPMPQPTNSEISINYSNYYGLAVSRQSPVSGWAWDFIIYLTANPNGTKIYLEDTSHPPALRSLIAEGINDPQLSIFAKSALTARSWYEADDERITGIFNQAIKSVLTGQADSGKALRQAQDQVTQLMR